MKTGVIASRLIAYALDGVPCTQLDAEQINYERLLKFSKAHSVVNVVGYALQQLNILPEEYAQQFLREIKLGMVREATQEMETLEISQQLEQRGIRHMLLKGWVMKRLYPRPDLRSMCDIDIQYDTAFKDELDSVMLPLGYVREETSGTDGINISYRKKPFMYIEFHGALMDKDVPLYNEYFDTDFRRTVSVEGCRVEYGDEDFFVFMMAHLAKHYFMGGSGLRSLADIWLFLRKKEKLDKEYMFGELKKIRLDEFTRIMTDVCAVLFEGAEPTRQQKAIIIYMLGGGTYGTTSNAAAESVKNRGKLSYITARLFPDRDFMAINYPLVKKCVLLLPVFWIVRLVSTFIKKGYKGSDVDLVMNVSEEQTDARKIPGNPQLYRKDGIRND